jgi:hypothetical protein
LNSSIHPVTHCASERGYARAPARIFEPPRVTEDLDGRLASPSYASISGIATSVTAVRNSAGRRPVNDVGPHVVAAFDTEAGLWSQL